MPVAKRNMHEAFRDRRRLVSKIFFLVISFAILFFLSPIFCLSFLVFRAHGELLREYGPAISSGENWFSSRRYFVPSPSRVASPAAACSQKNFPSKIAFSAFEVPILSSSRIIIFFSLTVQRCLKFSYAFSSAIGALYILHFNFLDFLKWQSIHSIRLKTEIRYSSKEST